MKSQEKMKDLGLGRCVMTLLLIPVHCVCVLHTGYHSSREQSQERKKNSYIEQKKPLSIELQVQMFS